VRRLTIICNWMSLSILAAGMTILLGSLFNIQNEKMLTAAMYAGILVFSSFLIKSFAIENTRLEDSDKEDQIASE
jgi:hypothetical protein